MDEEKWLKGLNCAKSLSFTEAQYKEALKLVDSPDQANGLIIALLDVSRDAGELKCQSAASSNDIQTEESATSIACDRISSSSCYSSIASFQSNESLRNPNPLRKVYIDGQNVAKTHGQDVSFSWLGIKICVEWFSSRNHRVKVIVPENRCQSIDKLTESYLNELGALIKSPSSCNDDLCIINAAMTSNGVIVSNDLFRDEKRLNEDMQRFIHLNRLPYVFDDDTFIPASDPRGRFGPSLDEFLRESVNDTNYNSRQSAKMSKHQTRYQRNGSLVKPNQGHNLAHRRSLQATRSGVIYPPDDPSPFNEVGPTSRLSSFRSPSSSLQSIQGLNLNETRGLRGDLIQVEPQEDLFSSSERNRAEPIAHVGARRRAVYRRRPPS